ncbi:MAG: ABC transporter ATP-binding protein [Planctomycetes bacterium]|jgi:iron complex transport system ATP-binding protein|nr:ABC transporter ATP-binding protein [Planctomycetota bacterium]
MTALNLTAVTVTARGRALLDGVSLSLAPGEFLALIGPNGAGKTTLIRAALGMVKPASGKVHLAGDDPRALSGRERAARAAWLPQTGAVIEAVSALELVEAARFRFNESRATSREAAQAALARVRAGALAARPVTQLSGGEQQRVALAAMIAQQAPLLMLDEPANHLDPAQQIATYRLIGELWREGRAVLCVTHDLNLLRHAGDCARMRVAGLADGRVAFDTTMAAAALPDRVAELFGVRVSARDGVILAEDISGVGP